MVKKSIKKSRQFSLENSALNLTNWVGTPTSILIHTFFFIGIFSLKFFGVSIDQILLVLTTLVSLEAIYLAIFIQMTVNRSTQSLAAVEDDIDDLKRDFDDLEEDIEEIQVEEDENEDRDEKSMQTLETMQEQLQKIIAEIEVIKSQKSSNGS